MDVKRLFLASIVWTIVMIGGGFVLAWRLSEQLEHDVNAAERAKSLGRGIGTVTGIGYGVIWIPYAFRVGQKRREEQKRPGKGKRRR